MSGFGLGLGGALGPLGLGQSISTDFQPVVYGPVAETIAVDPVLLTASLADAADFFSASYLIEAVRAQSATATSGVGVAGALVAAQGVVLLHHLRIALAQVPNHKFQLTSGEALGVDDGLLSGRPITLTSGVGLALSQQATLSIAILEELGLLPVLGPMLKYGKVMSETVGVAAALERFLGASLTSGVGMTSVLTGNAHKPATLTQGIGVAPAQAHQLVLKVTAEEDIGLNDINVLQLLYSPEISEGIELSAAYLSPGNSITTWAINTRTGAVTEYSNYAFNSFARLGDKYVGATSDGLYELLGDDDDGTDIIAQIKSGFAQWAGTKFTLFKSAYLGVRGEGEFILRLITGEGQTYDYEVSTRDMRSTKVHMGKGLRARYFRFELISTGQDFDLESIEFVPLVADRRV
jgi:hypothetical protein